MAIINVKCPRCGNNETIIINKKNGVLNKEYGECTKCHYLTYREGDPVNAVQCPYCHSLDVKKISNASKVAGVATFGILALGKATKEWHCNNCKSNF